MTAPPTAGDAPMGANVECVGANGFGGRLQSGAALVVALVLLATAMVIGTSAMNTATLQIVMAGNMAAHDLAFQAVATGIDLAIARRDFSVESPDTLLLTTLDDGATTEATIVFSGSTPIPDAAFSLGGGATELQAFHFEIRAVGTGHRNAVSTQRQGFYVLGPADPAAP